LLVATAVYKCNVIQTKGTNRIRMLEVTENGFGMFLRVEHHVSHARLLPPFELLRVTGFATLGTNKMRCRRGLPRNVNFNAEPQHGNRQCSKQESHRLVSRGISPEDSLALMANQDVTKRSPRPCLCPLSPSPTNQQEPSILVPLKKAGELRLKTAGTNAPAPLDSRWSIVYHQVHIGGRTSSMAKETQQRNGLLQGTLDMLVLRTLLYGPAHGHQIGKHIQRTTNEFLQMQHGSLYPALHRLEKKGLVVSKWETAPDRNREFKYYRLTEKGRKQLVVEESQWKQMADAVASVMWPTAEES